MSSFWTDKLSDLICRSDDHGKSWVSRSHRINDILTPGVHVPAQPDVAARVMINSVAFNTTDPTMSTIALSYSTGDSTAGVSGGIMYSTNGGDTWTRHAGTVSVQGGQNGIINTPVNPMVFSQKAGSRVVYVGSGMKYGCGSPGDGRGPRTYYSEDGGRSFVTNPQFATSVSCMSVLEVVIDPWTDNTTYLRTSNGEGRREAMRVCVRECGRGTPPIPVACSLFRP